MPHPAPLHPLYSVPLLFLPCPHAFMSWDAQDHCLQSCRRHLAYTWHPLCNPQHGALPFLSEQLALPVPLSCMLEQMCCRGATGDTRSMMLASWCPSTGWGRRPTRTSRQTTSATWPPMRCSPRHYQSLQYFNMCLVSTLVVLPSLTVPGLHCTVSDSHLRICEPPSLLSPQQVRRMMNSQQAFDLSDQAHPLPQMTRGYLHINSSFACFECWGWLNASSPAATGAVGLMAPTIDAI